MTKKSDHLTLIAGTDGAVVKPSRKRGKKTDKNDAAATAASDAASEGGDDKATVPDPPAHLDEVGRAMWLHLAPTLVQEELLTKLDDGSLEMLCIAYSHFRHCEAVIAKEGRTYTTHGRMGKMHRLRPEVALSIEMMKQVRAFSQEIGSSPAARKRLKDKIQLEFNLKKGKKDKGRFFRGS